MKNRGKRRINKRERQAVRGMLYGTDCHNADDCQEAFDSRRKGRAKQNKGLVKKAPNFRYA